MKVPPIVTVSIVSHGQGELVRPLLIQLASLAQHVSLRVIVTLNLPEDREAYLVPPEFDLRYIQNEAPKGFGENHNAALTDCDTPYLCVINPDVRLAEDPFQPLIDCLRLSPGVVGPLVRSSEGRIEDSARRIPTIRRLAMRLFSRHRCPDYPSVGLRNVEWVAGMFMLFDSESFRRVGGFDEKYHLYCEDVDICIRMWLAGYSVSWCADVTVVHEAQRASRKRIRFLLWHLRSMLRLFLSSAYRNYRKQLGRTEATRHKDATRN